MSLAQKFNLEVITGPMFAGKTTYIINKYNSYKKSETLLFNHAFDKRYYGTDDVISTHNKEYIPCIKATSCTDIYSYLMNFNFRNNIRNIIIDECQFFKDIYDFVYMLNKSNIPISNVVLAGLNLDATGKVFNMEFEKVLQYANKVHMLEAKCYKCQEPAKYSICLIDNKLDEHNVLVGDKEVYQPSCKKHINF
jgi:thymidine kinase